MDIDSEYSNLIIKYILTIIFIIFEAIIITFSLYFYNKYMNKEEKRVYIFLHFSLV